MTTELRLLRAAPASTFAEPRFELKLTFHELLLIYRSLLVVKSLGALAPQDEVLLDAIHLVDLALAEAA
jgi:hypothetical protein